MAHGRHKNWFADDAQLEMIIERLDSQKPIETLTVFFTGLPSEPFFFGVIVTLQVPLVLSLMMQVVLPLLILQRRCPRLVDTGVFLRFCSVFEWVRCCFRGA